MLVFELTSSDFDLIVQCEKINA